MCFFLGGGLGEGGLCPCVKIALFVILPVVLNRNGVEMLGDFHKQANSSSVKFKNCLLFFENTTNHIKSGHDNYR